MDTPFKSSVTEFARMRSAEESGQAVNLSAEAACGTGRCLSHHRPQMFERAVSLDAR